MSFLELTKKRYSVRKYKDEPVEREKLLQVLEAARYAPSACNYQPWHFIVVTDEELKNRIAETYPRDWFREAPVVIVACGDHSASWKRGDGKDHCDVDLAIAIEHMALAAADLGLGPAGSVPLMPGAVMRYWSCRIIWKWLPSCPWVTLQKREYRRKRERVWTRLLPGNKGRTLFRGG